MFDSFNVDGTVRLSLELAGYEFPDANDNWCLVRVAVRQGVKSFEAVEPSLEATELHHICDWFEALSVGRLPRYATLTFTEPCLAFEFLAWDASGVRFAINLCAELRPPFPLEQLGFEDDDWGIVFHLPPSRLEAMAAAATATFERFPPRAPRQ